MEKFIGFKSWSQGFSHLSSGTPCQDAVNYSCDKYAICVAADGHGSEKYFRSKEGAKFAVDVSLVAVKEFLERIYNPSSDDTEKYDLINNNVKISLEGENRDRLLQGLSSHIVSRWVETIRNDWDSRVCTDKEFEIFDKHFPNNTPTDKGLNITKIYGTTLIIGVMTDDFVFIIQCGDGGACVIYTDGKTEIAKDTFDDNQLGGMTNSLSASNCLNTFRYFYTEDPIIALFLVSDGVLESYGGNDGKDFLRFCEKLFEVYSNDYEQAQKFLDDWMPKLSERGNEDDVSIVAVYKVNNFNKVKFPKSEAMKSEPLQIPIESNELIDTIQSVPNKVQFGKHQWIVWDTKEDMILLLCDSIIEKRAFNSDNNDILWEKSDLRKYLNEDFLSIYDREEKDKIIEISNIEENTLDKIFILSIDELQSYFGNESQTESKKPGIWIDDLNNEVRKALDTSNALSKWWLRSLGKNGTSVAIVEEDGKINIMGVYANTDSIGVRPAMWIKK
jgi:hypothetical protein